MICFSVLVGSSQTFQANTPGSKNISLGQAWTHVATVNSGSYWFWLSIATVVLIGAAIGIIKYLQTGTFTLGVAGIAFAALFFFFAALLMRPAEVAANTSVDQAARGVYIGY